MIKIGVIGYGYWGPNIVRNFASHSEVSIVKICDMKEERLRMVRERHPNVQAVTDMASILNDKMIDVVAIVTPVYTHYEIAKKALLNGKHIFIEKPFTSTSAQAEELINIAEQKNLKIMVDHTFLYTGAVQKIKELINNGTIGKLYYYDSVRVNLGLFQHDINVIWDLATHDISIMDYLIDDLKPISVNSVGAEHFNKGLEDMAYLTVKYENNFIGHFHVNWLSPVKVRKTLVAGDKKMIVWDDLSSDEKIKVYDKGIDIENTDDIYDLLVKYRSGEMNVPVVKNIEALKLETEYFIDCLKNNKIPINDGKAGLRIVKILEASDISLKNDGKEIKF